VGWAWEAVLPAQAYRAPRRLESRRGNFASLALGFTLVVTR